MTDDPRITPAGFARIAADIAAARRFAVVRPRQDGKSVTPDLRWLADMVIAGFMPFAQAAGMAAGYIEGYVTRATGRCPRCGAPVDVTSDAPPGPHCQA